MIELENKVVEASKAYYSGNPIMSDSAFDEMIDELRKVHPESELLNTVGWGGEVNESHLEKFPHSTFIGGLPEIKIHNIESLPESEFYVESDKLDGITGVAYYENGELVRVLTRFDGKEGLDITKNLEYANIPKSVPVGIKSVRGEVLITRKDFDEVLSEHYSNERNAVAGMCNQKNLSDELKKYIKFVAYDIPESEDLPHLKSKWDKLRMIEACKFNPVNYTVHLSRDSVIQSLKEFNPYERSIEFLLDGAVVDIQSENKTVKVKYPAVIKEVEVVCVIWQQSKHGKLIPVIQTKPIELDGAMVTRFSGFNAKAISDNGIGAGAIIKVCRSNMVIPHWHSTVKSTQPDLPEEVYGEKVYWDGVHLAVSVDVKKPFLHNLLAVNKVDGIGWTAITEAVSVLGIQDASQLVNISRLIKEHKPTANLIVGTKNLLDHFGDSVRYHKLIQTLENITSRTYTIADLIEMMNLKGVGGTAAHTIGREVSHGEFLWMLSDGALSEDLAKKLPNYVACNSIIENRSYILEILELDLEIVDYVVEEPKEGLKVCATGSLSMTRSKLFNEWAKHGVIETDAGKADVLVCSGEGSSKWKTAKKRGIPILTEEEFVSQYLK